MGVRQLSDWVAALQPAIGEFSFRPGSVRRLLAAMRLVAALLVALSLSLMWVMGRPATELAWGVPLCLIGFNIVTQWLVPGGHPDADRGLAGHLVFDTAVLCVFFWFTGGATNPFVSLFLLPVAFAGAALGLRGAALVTLASIAGYTVLLLRYLMRTGHPAMVVGFERHIIGMWATFVLAALLLCGFLWALAARVRAGERELAAQRERLMRDDALVSVATVAAGAAHALNTPLATILVAAESLSEQAELSDDAREDARTIRHQAELAARELRALVAARDPAAQQTVAPGVFVDQVIARWRTRRPEIELAYDGWPAWPSAPIRHDPALAQSLHNLLDNAADAALNSDQSALTLSREATADGFIVCIDDPGRGPVPADSPRPGASTKPSGLGLGLTLARASVARLGGELVFQARPAGAGRGTRTRIAWPRTALSPERGQP